MRLALLLVVGCSSKESAPPRVEPKPPADASTADTRIVAADAEPLAPVIPRSDAGPADYSKLVTAEWPTAMEVQLVSRGIDVDYPIFRVRPKALADELAAKFAADIAISNTMESGYYFRCQLVTTSRIAVIVRCGKMVDTGEGGAPAGPHPQTHAYWLQPGLPEITLDQIAPGIDVGKLIATANKIEVEGCRMSECELSPEHFTISATGIELVPGEYCYGCGDRLPQIPLDQLKPTHPWAVKWLTWIHQRVDAGETLVKYQR